MGWLIGRRIMAAWQAFRKPALIDKIIAGDDFDDFDNRQLRYSIFHAYYESTAYDNVHLWATRYKTDYALMKYIRNIFNPAGRICDFEQTHIWGGALDMEAGDGFPVPSALPIATDNDDLRPAIAQVWEWSNWQINKDIYTLRGSIFGDNFIKIIDDVGRGKVYKAIVDPIYIADVIKDEFGNIKAYKIEFETNHPSKPNQTCKYTETAEHGDNDDIIFRTYLNDSLYAWGTNSPEWVIPYGFIPMVHTRHIPMGTWGWSELHRGLSKFREVDDIVSGLDDQIRKEVNPPWFIAGSIKSGGDKKIEHGTPSTDRPMPGRENIATIYAAEGSSATPMISKLDIMAVSEHLKSLNAEIERDYPELQDDIWNAEGATSGRALRIARQRPESKIMLRRPNYDNAEVKSNQMAIAIGGWRGYNDAFRGFDLSSYERGELDHSIAQRPVFAKDPLDELEQEEIFWKNLALVVEKAGIVPEAFLENAGWSEDRIRRLLRRQSRNAINNRRNTARQASTQQNTGTTNEAMPETEDELEVES